MGKLKQLLPCPTQDGPKPLVAAAYDSIRVACDQMIVVVGHESEKVIGALRPRDFHVVHANPADPMYESIRAGLKAAEQLALVRPVLVHPADHPEVSEQTLRTIAQYANDHPRLAISPCHDGRGGHPVFLPSTLLPRLIHWTGTGGLRQFWAENPESLARLSVDDAPVIRDLDSPEDYDQWVANRDESVQ